MRTYLFRLCQVCAVVLSILTSTASSAQTFPTSCTSKDLELISATLPAPANDRCNCSGSRTLTLGIRNKTGSTRTSFALWGTLIRYAADGHVISTTAITACAGPVQSSSDNFLPATSGTGAVITVNCGESLSIVNLHLAWTSASPNETCASLFGHPETINPKCGTLDSIHVGIGIEAALTVTNASCTAGGSLVVAPSGGLAPYQVCLYKKNTATDSTLIDVCRNVAAGGTTTFSGLATGDYTVTTTDNMNQPAIQRCFLNKFTTITQPESVSTPAATVDQPTCTVAAGTVHVTSPQSGVTYKLVDKSDNTKQYTASSGTFSSIPPGSYTFTGTKGACSTNGADVTVNPQPQAPAAPTLDVTQPNCTLSTGTITVTSSTTGLSFSLNSTTPADFTNTTGVFSGLSAGTYTIRAKNSDGCISGGASKTVDPQPPTPTFKVCLVQPTLCASTGTVTINVDPGGGSGLSYSIHNGADAQNTNVFSNLASGSVTSVKVTNSDGCSATVSCANLSNYIDANCGSSISKASAISEQTAESVPAVKAYPNPFSDRINFVVTTPISGKGSLEVYNMVGQKVKTIYQGFIAAGTQTFQMSSQKQQVANLIYVLRIGDKKISGRILQINQ